MPPDATGPTPVASPSHGDRFRDVLALTLLVLGLILVLVSHAGMQRLATQPIVVAHGNWAINQWVHFRRLEQIGYVSAAAGLVAGIWSYVMHAKRGPADAARPGPR
jgi:hypothetical protein